MRLRRNLQLLGDAKLPNDKLINLDAAYTGTADSEAPDG
jgi:hypothetical protein